MSDADKTTKRYFDPNKFQVTDMRDFQRKERRKRIAGWILLITLIVAGCALLSWYLG